MRKIIASVRFFYPKYDVDQIEEEMIYKLYSELTWIKSQQMDLINSK